MTLPVKDMLNELLTAPPHPAPVDAVDRRLRRAGRRRAAVVVAAAATLVVTAGAAQYAFQGPEVLQDAAPQSAVEPELGTIPTWDGYREKVASQGPAPNRLDLLARYSSAGITYFVAGHVGDGRFCYTQYDDHMDVPGGGAVTCGPWPLQRPANAPTPDPTRFFLNRSFSSGRGPATNTVSGIAPAGTHAIIIRAGDQEQRVPVFDSGERWDHLRFFNAPVNATPVSAVALDENNQPLATADAT